MTGQMPFTGTANDSPYPDGIEAQTRQVMENLKRVLAGCRLTLEDVVAARVFLAHFKEDYDKDEPHLCLVFHRRQAPGAHLRRRHRARARCAGGNRSRGPPPGDEQGKGPSRRPQKIKTAQFLSATMSNSTTAVTPDPVRTGLGIEAFKRAFLDNLFFVQGRFPRGHPQRQLHGPGLHRARPLARALDEHRQTYKDRRSAPSPTSRPSSCSARTSANLVYLGISEAARGDGRAGPRPRRAARAGRGAGPRQRRPRPPGGLLHGLAGHAADSRHRLRHPLRVRHLRPGDPRRLAGGGAPTSGCASATPGRSRGPRSPST